MNTSDKRLNPSRNTATLLSRDAFRESVFARDHHRCVACKTTDGPFDAHHIIERRLWPDGGYYLDNGATVCAQCHLDAERTTISPTELRAMAGITRTLIPPHLYDDQAYDKWGNPILDTGRRLRGDLFGDESVQKALREGGVLSLFDALVKYPRTPHLPWSPGRTNDDRVLDNVKHLEDEEVIATIKMDGENTTLYRDAIHARSVEGDSHPSQAHVRALQGRIGYELPPMWRIVVENVYATHSIRYQNLEAYEYLISVWNDRNECLSWDDTVEYAALLEIPTVPVFYRGPMDRAMIDDSYAMYADTNEGYVIRTRAAFSYGQFRTCVAKYVRPNHVRETVHNWRSGWYASPEHINTRKASTK